MNTVALTALIIGGLSALTALVCMVLVLRKRFTPPRIPLQAALLPVTRHWDEPLYGPSNPLSIGTGDMVRCGSSEYLVQGTVTLWINSRQRREHFLSTSDNTTSVRRWLSIEKEVEGAGVAILWEALVDTALNPAIDQLIVNGVHYTCKERGRGTYNAQGTTNLPERGSAQCMYYEDGDSNKYLSLVRYNQGPWEAGIGERIPGGLLDIYPPSD